ncbi:uncharacterized protein LOC134290870 [Aedes albopictus]|uniref:Integrase catalytic domain-containing protein n=1 Tax=Aedes albopictus TaxID=7160 RepID=A0ABM1YHW5_AEDAL
MHEWMYVPTKQNVADDGTKWQGLPDLTSQSRWFIGPYFLYCSEEDWPRSPQSSHTAELELRPSVMSHFIAPTSVICVDEYSCWDRIVKVVALLHRFPSNCKLKLLKKPTIVGPVPSQELKVAESYLFRQAQQETFPDEVAHLRRFQDTSESSVTAVPKSSPLHQKSPWLDHYGVMRMRGRIAACDYATEDAKYPIILPRDHHTTRLIVAHYHHKLHHQNHETVINEIRQKFSIPQLRSTYTKVRNNCQRCKNDRAVPRAPIMADLPLARLGAFTRPFTHVGVDFFGPYEVVVGRRIEKRWGLLATCLTIRAIHIEVVHSLSTNSCIMPNDRGTNFVGANRVLEEIDSIIKEEELMKEFVDTDTSWTFLPPASPHMGGSWERLIGSVKKNLMAILPARKLTDEVLRNLLTEIESTVNSRPLTHVPVDDDSAPALTPNHFLLGSTNGSKPLRNADDSGSVLRQTWLLSQVQANRFWKRGRIINIHLGKDGQPRSATVRTTSGIYERPTTKLAVLDVRRETK